jgi:anti-sigma-K factor RskA
MNTPNSGKDTLAAEYVLGVLDAQAQADAERRLQTDAAFAREVDEWRARFGEFDNTVAPMPADEGLWQRIEHGTRQPAGAGASRSAWRDLWHSLPVWRAATTLASVLAITLAVTAMVSLQFARNEAVRKPIYVAVLVDDATKNAGAVVNAFADGSVEMIPLAEINVPPDKALEIWTLWDRSVGPRSVGLIERSRSVRLNLDALPKTGENQLFEITLEPKTGSPIGRPTGPILFKGTTSRAL